MLVCCMSVFGGMEVTPSQMTNKQAAASSFVYQVGAPCSRRSLLPPGMMTIQICQKHCKALHSKEIAQCVSFFRLSRYVLSLDTNLASLLQFLACSIRRADGQFADGNK